ncbi:MAG: PIN domain-containing protein [Desulfovibrionaceae bacterium]|nr:PIN domain-containing protein [Desulfovibrionaceae bacterium]
MIKALIDTNVVLDALAGREPFRAEAEKIFMLAAEVKFQAVVTANCITDVYYLVRKNTSETLAREALRNLFQVFAVVDIRGKDCENALESAIGDYEDALAAACASKIDADSIITRDGDFLQAQSPVPVVAPAGFLKIFAGH